MRVNLAPAGTLSGCTGLDPFHSASTLQTDSALRSVHVLCRGKADASQFQPSAKPQPREHPCLCLQWLPQSKHNAWSRLQPFRERRRARSFSRMVSIRYHRASPHGPDIMTPARSRTVSVTWMWRQAQLRLGRPNLAARPSAMCWPIETGASVNSITLSASKTCYRCFAGPA